MAKEDLELVALAMMAVTARLPGEAFDTREYPVLGEDTGFHHLPADDGEATVDDLITQETVLKLAAAAMRAVRLPTKRMTAAGAAQLVDGDGESTEADQRKAGEVFQAMIEEVLRE